MNCEIEFLPVGSASKAGDAIVIRYGTPSAYDLMIVDGGFAETGPDVVKHVREQFGAHPIAHVVLSHLDQDHAGGLREVLSELDVRNFWLNEPWDIDAAMLPFFADKTLRREELQRKLLKEYDTVAELVGIARRRGIPIHRATAGTGIGPFVVLSPSRDFFQLLIPQFDRTPAPDEEALRAVGAWVEPAVRRGVLAAFASRVADAVKTFLESWTNERLRDGGKTSATNESSVVLYGRNDRGPVLLTADAGIVALNRAADYATTRGLPLAAFSLVQVPHHGSRSNVGPQILDRLLGPKQSTNVARFSAYVSAPPDDATHPRQMVLNAFMRRGGQVVATQGTKKVHWGGFPPRDGYVASEAKPFVSAVEDYD